MKIMTIFGTRPEGIKMAPIVKAITQDAELKCIFINTAQHREMLDQVTELFDIKPDYDLDLMKHGQKVEEITGLMFSKLTSVIQLEKPDLVLVHGDTTSTFIGAYAAFMQKIPVGHVEAGLRTNDIYSPFPEEMNRQMVGRIASYHFAATQKNKENLLREGVEESNIYVVGNTVIDALLEITSRDFQFDNNLNRIFSNGLKTILLTTHRRENYHDLENIYKAINHLIDDYNDVQVVFPIHKNPNIRNKVKESLQHSDRIHIIEPLNYETFVHAMKHSYIVITDSGGIQEEAPSLGKPVLVARNTTERQEGVDAGTLKVVGTSTEKIYDECSNLLSNKLEYAKMGAIINPFGTGETASKIVELIKSTILTEQFSPAKYEKESKVIG